jgi:hypothetical protein
MIGHLEGVLVMRVVFPNERPKPFIGPRTHARLRHDYGTWHEVHRSQVLASREASLPYEDRSKSDSYLIIEDAIKASELHLAQVRDASNKNFVITFDMGYDVGYDAQAKRKTSSVTVILSSLGEVITVHPGTPWSRDWDEA